jgi:hypothetical protein
LCYDTIITRSIFKLYGHERRLRVERLDCGHGSALEKREAAPFPKGIAWELRAVARSVTMTGTCLPDLACPVDDIPRTQVLYTIVGGRVVYQRK